MCLGRSLGEINKLTHNLRHVSGAFIEEINKLTHNLRHNQIRKKKKNCAFILFISSMNAPDTCRKLCVNLFISSMNASDTCLKLCLHFIYFFNERFRPLPQIVLKCRHNLKHVSGTFIEEINKFTHNLRHVSGAVIGEMNKI
jgi:hypothetical protein